MFFWWLIGPGGYTVGGDDRTVVDALVALAFGASLISIFARLGGGIFTKAADVGADLVGKVEAGIPEDDPRNPAVIADNVGDNVGDCAGMAADLFETYVVTVGATMVLTALLFKGLGDGLIPLMGLPLLIGGVCIVTSIIGTYFVRLGTSGSSATNIMGAMYKGFLVTAVLSVPAIFAAIWFALDGDLTSAIGGSGMAAIDLGAPLAEEGVSAQVVAFTGMDLFWCSLVGLVITGLIIWITEYYTGTNYRPVRSIAKSSETGHGTNVIQGLAISMEATAPAHAGDLRRHRDCLPARRLDGHRLCRDRDAGTGRHGGCARTPMVRSPTMLAVSPKWPGWTMMSARKPMRWDAVGNTTKAVTKGYAIGSAGLAALVLFAAYTTDLREFFPTLDVDFSLENPYVIVGLLLGALLPYLFGSMGMTAVGRAAGDVVKDVRDQFAGDSGIMAGTSKPDYARTVDLVTKAAIKEMIVPSLLPVLAPIVVYFVITAVAGQQNGFAALGALLLGVIVGGLFRRAVDDQRRRRMGQCQEIYRGWQSRRQGQRRPSRGSHRRHGGRSIQGYRRPRGQPDDQDHQHRRAAAAGRTGEPFGGVTTHIRRLN